MGLLLLTLVWFGFFYQLVLGHAGLVSVNPADGSHLDTPPTEIVLEFSEPVGIVENGTILFQQNADSQVLNPIVDDHKVYIPLDMELSDGAYVVQWRVISADSHPVAGTVNFTVGDENHALSIQIETLPGWIENARVAAVAVKYLGILTAIGVLVFGLLIIRCDWRELGNLTRWFFGIACAGALLEIPFAAMVQTGLTLGFGQPLWDAYKSLDSGYRTSAVVLVSMLVMGIVFSRLKIRTGLKINLMLLVAIGAGLSQVLSGHSRTKVPVWLMMVSDSVHILMAGVWLGGLLVLTLGLLGRWKGSAFETENATALVVSRFSTLAGWSLLLVGVSGITMGVTILRSLEALVDTGYGITLIVKTAMVGGVVVIAAANRFILVPRIVRSREPTMLWLKRLVAVELILLVIVVGVTARLVHLNPNVEIDIAEQQMPVTLHSDQVVLDAEHSAHLTVELTGAFEYRVTLHLLDAEGKIVQTSGEPVIRWFMPEESLGPIDQPLIGDGSGGYTGRVTLPLSGTWQVEVRAWFDRFTDSRVTVEVTIPD